jgi:hypothetical protein
MKLLDHGAADTLGLIGRNNIRRPSVACTNPFRCASLDRYGIAERLYGCRAAAAQVWHPAATSEWRGVHFAALIRTSKIF